jgi:phosphoglycolate phosphatase
MMISAKPSVILFDMDGTTVRHINPRWLHILDRIDDAMFAIDRFINKKSHTTLPASPSKQNSRLIVHRALHKIRRKPVEQIVEPCPGVREVLELARDIGIPMAVVSNGLGKGYGHDILEKFDLKQYFKAAIFREDFTLAKPHPQPLINALNAMGMEVSNTDTIWCVGDRRKDILAGLALETTLGCKVHSFSYGLQAAITILEKHIPTDHILTTYHDLYTKLLPFKPAP